MRQVIALLLVCFVWASNAQAYEPSPAEREAAKAFAARYLADLGAGDYETAYGMHAELLNQKLDYAAWVEKERDFSQSAGGDALHTLASMSWHFDPPKAPLEGFYVEFDVACQYQNLDPCRATLVLHSVLGETFSVMRYSRSYVNTKTGKREGRFIKMPGHYSRL